MTKNVYQQAVESAAREAKGSDADRWSTAYVQDCRDGKRELLFPPRPPDTDQSGAPSGASGESGGGLFSGLRNLLTFQ